MNTKLTLTIEKRIIEQAKRLARKHNRSLSDMVENFFKVLIKEQQPKDVEINPLVKSLKGSFKPPKHFDYKKELQKIKEEKYLK
jgi:succinyl-CoA synthetase beta subunit